MATIAAMNTTVDVFLVPVLDRHDVWAGIWVRCAAGHADMVESLCAGLYQEIGGLRIFLDAGDGLPAACLDRLLPEKTWFVGSNDDEDILRQMKERGFHTVFHGRQFAAGIDNQGQFDAAKTQGVEWFSGKFITHPPSRPGGAQDVERVVLMSLLTLVAQDADSAEIEQVFKREPKLSFNLFRLVNSVSMGLSTKISTFGQAIMVLGRRQLQRWIQLLLYTNNKGNDNLPSPLLQLAAMRGRLMECLAIASGWDAAEQERAFMVGSFSLLDSLLGMSMAEIVKVIPLQDDIQSALLTREGGLGEMLALVEGLQAGHAGITLPAAMNLGVEDIADCQSDALRWAVGVAQGMN